MILKRFSGVLFRRSWLRLFRGGVWLYLAVLLHFAFGRAQALASPAEALSADEQLTQMDQMPYSIGREAIERALRCPRQSDSYSCGYNAVIRAMSCRSSECATHFNRWRRAYERFCLLKGLIGAHPASLAQFMEVSVGCPVRLIQTEEFTSLREQVIHQLGIERKPVVILVSSGLWRMHYLVLVAASLTHVVWIDSCASLQEDPDGQLRLDGVQWTTWEILRGLMETRWSGIQNSFNGWMARLPFSSSSTPSVNSRRQSFVRTQDLVRPIGRFNAIFSLSAREGSDLWVVDDLPPTNSGG